MPSDGRRCSQGRDVARWHLKPSPTVYWASAEPLGLARLTTDGVHGWLAAAADVVVVVLR